MLRRITSLIRKKIKRELEAYRKKPKKKGGFQARLEEALKEQQKIQAEKEAAKKKEEKEIKKKGVSLNALVRPRRKEKFFLRVCFKVKTSFLL